MSLRAVVKKRKKESLSLLNKLTNVFKLQITKKIKNPFCIHKIHMYSHNKMILLSLKL